MINKIIDKIKHTDYKELFKSAKNGFINFLKNNYLFIAYVIFTLISCMLVRYFTIGTIWNVGAVFFDFAVILLVGSIGFLIRKSRRFLYWNIIMVIVTIINLINSIYYAFFNSFVSFSLLESLGQTGEVTDAVFEKLRPSNFIYLLFLVLFIVFYRYLKKKKYGEEEKKDYGKRVFTGVAIIGGICLFINISALTGTDLSRFSKQWNREYVVERFGIIVYQGNDLFQTINIKLKSIFGYEEAMKRFQEYFKTHPYEESDNKYTNKFKGYNVIAIHMESIMSFLVNMEINGVEVTPYLNKLVKESMYFDNFYPQVSTGTSSDTEFTFSSSLMPVQSGTVFVSYYNRSYVTLQNLLAKEGYYTFSMHGNKASMWNRNKMHPTLGYKDFYSQEYYTIDEEIGLGLSDRSFFTQSEALIKQIEDNEVNSGKYNNYMGTLITLTNHTPWADDYYLTGSNSFDVTYHTGKLDEKGEEIIYPYLEESIMGNYIKSVHYADQALGEFIEYVKEHEEYDKTLFVFYGDHAAQISRSDFANFVNYDFETGLQKTEDNPTYVNYDYYENELFKNTPLIFWTKDKKITGKVSYPMGMIDVLPTLSNMLGIKNEYALGHDIFEIKNDNVIVFPNGNFLTNKMYYYNSKNESRIFETETFAENYIEEKKKYAENILEISNDIIVYDLIAKSNEKKGVSLDGQEESNQ